MVVRYAIWCPQGYACKKGGRRVAACLSPEEARERLLAHLWGSPAHKELDEQTRKELADTADVAEEDFEDLEDLAASEEAPPKPAQAVVGKRVPTAPTHPPPAKRMKGSGKGEWTTTIAAAITAGVKAGAYASHAHPC